MDEQAADGRVGGRGAYDVLRVRLRAEVKVRRDGVLEKMYQEIARQQQRHRAEHGLRCGFARLSLASTD